MAPFAFLKSAAATALIAAVAGCDATPAAPESHPVQGRIEFQRGGDIKSLWDRQGAIQFQSVDQPDVHAYGEINEDGTFVLNSFKGTESWEGVVPGRHRGRLNLDEEVQKLVASRFLDYRKSGIELDVPTSGEVVIKIWK